MRIDKPFFYFIKYKCPDADTQKPCNPALHQMAYFFGFVRDPSERIPSSDIWRDLWPVLITPGLLRLLRNKMFIWTLSTSRQKQALWWLTSVFDWQIKSVLSLICDRNSKKEAIKWNFSQVDTVNQNYVPINNWIKVWSPLDWRRVIKVVGLIKRPPLTNVTMRW